MFLYRSNTFDFVEFVYGVLPFQMSLIGPQITYVSVATLSVVCTGVTGTMSLRATTETRPDDRIIEGIPSIGNADSVISLKVISTVACSDYYAT